MKRWQEKAYTFYGNTYLMKAGDIDVRVRNIIELNAFIILIYNYF